MGDVGAPFCPSFRLTFLSQKAGERQKEEGRIHYANANHKNTKDIKRSTLEEYTSEHCYGTSLQEEVLAV